MALHNRRLRRSLLRIVLIIAILSILLVALMLVGNVQREDATDNVIYLRVLTVSAIALAVLGIAIVFRVASLIRRVRREEPGARLAARWVRNFLVLSLPPALIVYLFSAYFLTETVDNWFDIKVETALANSLSLGREFLDRRTLEVRNQTRRMTNGLNLDDTPEELRRTLLNNVSAAGPVELSLLNELGSAIATASYNATALFPERPDNYSLLQALEGGEYAAAEPTEDGNLSIRVLQRLPGRSAGQVFLIQGIYPLPERTTALTRSIEAEYFRYRNVSYLRESLKKSFLLILTLVLSLTVLLAILAALRSARRMVSPLSQLAEAAERVATGDLAQAVETNSRDEIGFLSESFNDMTSALETASDEAERGRQRLQAQGTYLETVLGSLSAGVLTLDTTGHLVRVNEAAEEILGLPAGIAIGQSLDELSASFDGLLPLAGAISRQIARGRKDWRQEIRVERPGSPLVLVVRGSGLPGIEDNPGGYVVVFDDVTILNQAQRDAAWAEVARRLAHEVKNPLTPIRLAAERLHMKLRGKLEGDDADLLDRSATTIVAQVEALRKLVDAFGDYAREPDMERKPVQFDELVRELVHLYRQAGPQPAIEIHLCPGPEDLHADEGQLRQLLHNLIGNAREALGEQKSGLVTLRTSTREHRGSPWLDLEIFDNGPGFPEKVLSQPFEPYVTSKPEGSGLGLAISRKIVTDHNGTIKISNLPSGGALARVSLPLGKDKTGGNPFPANSAA